MMRSCGNGWMTTLADLSIILFMITAADLSRAGLADTAQVVGKPLAEPVASFRPGNGAPSLTHWLASQPADPRQRLTVLIQLGGRAPDDVLQPGLVLMRQAEKAGYRARLIVEQADAPDTIAYLAYDAEDIR